MLLCVRVCVFECVCVCLYDFFFFVCLFNILVDVCQDDEKRMKFVLEVVVVMIHKEHDEANIYYYIISIVIKINRLYAIFSFFVLMMIIYHG
jgi:hypothetical protein